MTRTHRNPLISLALLALLTLLPAGLVLAQGGPPEDAPGFHRGGDFGHRLGRLARALELTEEQLTAARQLAEAHRAEVRPLREQQRAARESVRTLLDQQPQDAAAIGQAVINAHTVGEQIHASFEQLKADFRALLTQEQQERLDELRELRDNVRGDRGPGRHGRHGGPGFGN